MLHRKFFLPVLLLWAAAALAETSSGYKISGVVVDHRTHSPLSPVLVSIAPVNGSNEQIVSVMTGADGRFQFSGLAPGKYSLSAQRRSEQPQQFRQHGPFSTAIVTGPGLDSEHVVFPLTGEARLSGVVLADDGEPVTGAAVMLLGKLVWNGKRQILTEQQQNTGNSGSFHFSHLKPGTYYLAVSARPWYASGPSYTTRADSGGAPVTERVEPPPLLDVAYPVTYSGDATEGAAAQPIILSEGSAVKTQINLRAVPALHISIPSGDSGSNAAPDPVSGMGRRQMMPQGLSAVGPGGVLIFTQGMFSPPPNSNGADTSEEISGIAPGTYTLNRQALDSNGQTLMSEEVLTLSASGPVPAGHETQATYVRGRVVFDGVAPKDNVFLQAIANGQGSGVLIQKEGAFDFQKPLPPGHYKLALAGDPGIEIRSISFGQSKVAGSTLEIPRHAAGPLELTVIAGTAVTSTVSGIALRKGEPVAGVMVLLIPVDSEHGVLTGRDQSDSDGTFSIPNVDPGRYTLVAIDPGENEQAAELEYQDPAVIKPYFAEGRPLTVPVATKEPVSVQVVSMHPGK